jgi:hypothetical protein
MCATLWDILTKAFILHNWNTDFYPFGIAHCQIFWELYWFDWRGEKYNHAGGQIYDRKKAQPPMAQHTGQMTQQNYSFSSKGPSCKHNWGLVNFFFPFLLCTPIAKKCAPKVHCCIQQTERTLKKKKKKLLLFEEGSKTISAPWKCGYIFADFFKVQGAMTCPLSSQLASSEGTLSAVVWIRISQIVR